MGSGPKGECSYRRQKRRHGRREGQHVRTETDWSGATTGPAAPEATRSWKRPGWILSSSLQRRERRREGERERETDRQTDTDQLPSVCAHSGDRTGNPGSCPDRKRNLQPLGARDKALTNRAARPGPELYLLPSAPRRQSLSPWSVLLYESVCLPGALGHFPQSNTV